MKRAAKRIGQPTSSELPGIAVFTLAGCGGGRGKGTVVEATVAYSTRTKHFSSSCLKGRATASTR